jgi:cholesterol oxidase
MSDGRWSVEVDHTDLTGKVIEQKIITTTALIMAGGSLGTTKLLVRAAAHGAIPDMPDDLGKGWGNNADRIYVWHSKDDFGKQKGGLAPQAR